MGAFQFAVLPFLLFYSERSFAWLSQHQTSLQKASVLFSTKSSQVPLSQSLEELSTLLGGKGRSKVCWQFLRLGVDPSWYFSSASNSTTEEVGVLEEKGWNRQQIQHFMSGENLANKATKLLKEHFGSIEQDVASLTKISSSDDGTTKLLLKLIQDDLEIESVIIPWEDRQKSTLCISSQVGCKQACTFCATGRMGKLRSLNSDEILAQMHWAIKICRISDIFPIDNVVFMGQGEPADNSDAVVKAAETLVDPNLYQLAPRRVTISTVAPSPESFKELGKAPVVLAWSVHASRDELRKQLVPTTKHTMDELRAGLIESLQGRSKRLRNIMIEITLLDQINDSEDDAKHLIGFCQPLLEQVQGIKLVVNLIPWNDIGASVGPASLYQKPKLSRVLAFQKILQSGGILCYIRTTRGDEENAACGMLNTKKH